ncbi:MAG: fibronectin type III domain-containing protein [Rhodobacteraceae bacterium]|nr:fibronectin type III domain-containing protein [Paracoccaceae bacterium]
MATQTIRLTSSTHTYNSVGNVKRFLANTPAPRMNAAFVESGSAFFGFFEIRDNGFIDFDFRTTASGATSANANFTAAFAQASVVITQGTNSLTIDLGEISDADSEDPFRGTDPNLIDDAIAFYNALSDTTITFAFDDTVVATKLTTPTGLSGTAGDGQVALSWTDISNEDNYELQYRIGSSGAWTDWGTDPAAGSTSATITGLTNGTGYQFRIRAIGDGTVYTDSDWSSPTGSVTPAAAPVQLAAPTGLTGTVGNARVALSWNAVANASNYTVQRRTRPTGSWGNAVTVAGTSRTITGLTNGQGYQFRVRANGDGTSYLTSAYSGPSTTLTPVAPPAPTISGRTITITLDTPVQNGQTVTISYSPPNADSDKIQDAAGNFAAAFAGEAVTNNVPGAVAVKLATPTGLTGTAGDGEVSLSWNAVANASDYDVQYRAGSSGSWTDHGSPSGTSTTVTGLTNSQAYEFRIRAGGDGTNYTDSDFSSAISTTPVAPAPTATKLATPNRPTGVAGNQRTIISWTDSNSGNESSYTIQYRIGSSGTWQNWTRTGSGDSETVTGLTNGTGYQFRVRADGDGTSYSNSDFSAPSATVTPQAQQLATPAAPTATAGNAQATITFTAVTNGSNYDVQRRAGSGSWVNVTRSDDTALSETITGLTNGTAYTFRIRAVGDGSRFTTSSWSAPSNSVTPTTGRTTTQVVRYARATTQPAAPATTVENPGAPWTTTSEPDPTATLNVYQLSWTRVYVNGTFQSASGSVSQVAAAFGTLTVSISSSDSNNQVPVNAPVRFTATPGGTATGQVTYQWQRFSGGSWVNEGSASALRTLDITRTTAQTVRIRVSATTPEITTPVVSSEISTQWIATTITAEAGPNQTIGSGNRSRPLGGADSITNPLGSTTYAWAITSGTGGSLSSATAREPTFQAPTLTAGSANRVFTITKRVTNNGVTSAADSVTITVTAPETSTITVVDTVYRLEDAGDTPNRPTGGTTNERHTPSGWDRDPPSDGTWTDDPQGPTTELPFEWVAKGRKVDGSWREFSNPALWSKLPLEGRADLAFIYKLAPLENTPTDRPSNTAQYNTDTKRLRFDRNDDDFDETASNGWLVSIPTTVPAGERIYIRTATASGVGAIPIEPNEWGDILPLGAAGSEGVGIEYIFRAASDDTTIASGLPNNDWGYDNPSTPYYDGIPPDTALNRTNPYLIRFSRKVPGQPDAGDLPYNVVSGARVRKPGWGNWVQDAAVLVVGADGAGREWIFRRTNSDTAPTIPTTSTANRMADDYRPPNWVDDPPSPTATQQYVWASNRKRTKTDENWQEFSTATLWSKWAKDGDGTQSLYSRNNTGTAPNSPSSGVTLTSAAYQQDNWSPSGNTWTRNPTGVTTDLRYEYISQRIKTNGTWGAYSTPALFSRWGEGQRGQRGSSGYLWWGGTATDTAPAKPSATGYNFTTGVPTGLSSTDWSPSPPTAGVASGSQSEVWTVYYTVLESGDYNEATRTWSGQTVTFGDVQKGISFTGVVSFDSRSGRFSSGDTEIDGETTTIDGGAIRTGTISVDKLLSNSTTTRVAVGEGEQFGLGLSGSNRVEYDERLYCVTGYFETSLTEACYAVVGVASNASSIGAAFAYAGPGDDYHVNLATQTHAIYLSPNFNVDWGGDVVVRDLRVTGNFTLPENVTVTGTLTVRGATSLQGGATVTGTLSATTELRVTSDRKVKENLVPIDNALDKLQTLVGYTFDKDGERSAGLIAQDVQKVLPEAVKEIEGMLTLSPTAVLGIAVQAINELKRQVDSLAKKCQ